MDPARIIRNVVAQQRAGDELTPKEVLDSILGEVSRQGFGANVVRPDDPSQTPDPYRLGYLNRSLRDQAMTPRVSDDDTSTPVEFYKMQDRLAPSPPRQGGPR